MKEKYTSICIHDQRNKKEERIVAITSTRQFLPCCFPLDQTPVFQKKKKKIWHFFMSFDLCTCREKCQKQTFELRTTGKKKSSATILCWVLWRNNSETSDLWFIFQLFWVMGVSGLNFKEPFFWNLKMHFGDLGVVYSLKHRKTEFQKCFLVNWERSRVYILKNLYTEFRKCCLEIKEWCTLTQP